MLRGCKTKGTLPQSKVAGIGQLSLSLTWEKTPENGVALSLARAHQIRPTCKTQHEWQALGKVHTVRKVPSTQIMMERNRMSNSPKVAPLLPVA